MDTGFDCRCDIREYTATFEVRWDPVGDTFVVENQAGHTTTPFIGIDTCVDDLTCTWGHTGVEGYGYKVYVDLEHTVLIDCPIDGWRSFYLDQVLYLTSAVDNGEFLDSGCYPGADATPNSQTWQIGDNGAWTCGTDCPTGVGIVIKY